MIIAVVIICLAMVLSFLVSIDSGKYAPYFIGGFTVFAISFLRTDYALYLLAVSMLLSPQFIIGQTAAREVTIRFDDFMIIMISFGWLARMALEKKRGVFIINPVNRHIVIYTFIIILSTLLGIQSGNVRPLSGFFFVAKMLEYFLVFFLTTQFIETEKQIRYIVYTVIAVGIIVALYGISQIPRAGEQGGITVPFETSGMERASFGGYMLLITGLSIAYLIRAREARELFFWGGTTLLFVLPLLYSLSRASILGLGASAFFFVFFAWRRPLHMLGMIFLLIAGLMNVPVETVERLQETFVSESSAVQTVKVGGYYLDESSSARLLKFGEITEKVFNERPLLGFGVTGFGFIDGHYFRVLAESGFIGLISFLALLASVFYMSVYVMRKADDVFESTLAFGFTGSLAGLCVQALTTNTFLIVRIMEPFWLIAGVIAVIFSRLYQSQRARQLPLEHQNMKLA